MWQRPKGKKPGEQLMKGAKDWWGKRPGPIHSTHVVIIGSTQYFHQKQNIVFNLFPFVFIAIFLPKWIYNKLNWNWSISLKQNPCRIKPNAWILYLVFALMWTLLKPTTVIMHMLWHNYFAISVYLNVVQHGVSHIY